MKNYSILKGVIVDSQVAKASNPHYSVKVVDDSTTYRIAINVKSKLSPPDLEFLLIPDFRHPLLDGLKELPVGMHEQPADPVKRKESGIALDYIRGNLFDRTQMKPLPPFVTGPHNDLNEMIDENIEFSMGGTRNLIYAFGERWGPETVTDKVFGFLPGNGIHDIHFNQGSTGQFKKDNGVYQDGGMILYFADEDRYVAYFTKFQSQTWHTDDATGHPIGTPAPGGGQGGPPPKTVRIVAAMVNPVGGDPEAETVTLLNATASAVDLTGWKLLDRLKVATPLSGTLGAGQSVVVAVKKPMSLPNRGGQITLINGQGLKVHGVSYTKAQAGQEGESIVF